MIAHVAGVPFEEVLPLAAVALGGTIVFARAWVGVRFRSSLLRRRSRAQGSSMPKG